MVHSSHRKVSLGRDGMPTPAMLAALTWNWYFLFSFRSDTWEPITRRIVSTNAVLRRSGNLDQTSAHPVGPLTNSSYVPLTPLSRHAVYHLAVIHKVAGDVHATDGGRLFPGQHHGVPDALQHGDAIGWSRGCWDDRDPN